MRIAILDDDAAQADLVGQTLSTAGHICHGYTEGRALLKQLRRQTFDLLVLDWNAGDVSGEEVLRWVRKNLSERLPVLFMTRRSHDSDIASILNTGADDYVIKPVSANVLLARVGSLLRRAYRLNVAAPIEIFNDYEFNLSARLLVVRGTPVDITQKEFNLALLLFQHLNRPLSRTHLRELIWNQVTDIPSRTIDTHISTLRRKLGLRPEYGYRLAPIYGFGYRLERLDRNGRRSGRASTPLRGDPDIAPAR
ncbi:MAG TPA: response regulator transcription factor [Paraburkholderia sp.]|jgi:DNA-binding response OmpR family regulator|nr:response regulator transcription factor [Paraburkholderia sp.]